MKKNTRLITRLKGTTFMLVIFIIQIILNAIFIGTLFYPLIVSVIRGYDVGWLLIGSTFFTAFISMLETLAVGLTYRGFKKGIKGWAIFAILYSLVMMVGLIVTMDLLNVTPLVLIAGFIGWQGKRIHTRVPINENEEVDIDSSINI